MIQGLVRQSLNVIAEQLATAVAPAVAWSGGKDSQVLLWLVRAVMPDIPVLYLHGFPHPTKHRFVLEIMRQWSLNLIRPLPTAYDVIGKNGHVEIIEVYQLTPNRLMYFPIEATQDYQPSADSYCGLQKLNDPVGDPLPWREVFIGLRGDEVDPTHGPLAPAEYVADYTDVKYIYPLKEWAEADIWEASHIYGIPQNEARYAGDMDANNDYYPVCTLCLGDQVRTVICPKTDQEIPTLGASLDLDVRRKSWYQTFVNLEGNPNGN